MIVTIFRPLSANALNMALLSGNLRPSQEKYLKLLVSDFKRKEKFSTEVCKVYTPPQSASVGVILTCGLRAIVMDNYMMRQVT